MMKSDVWRLLAAISAAMTPVLSLLSCADPYGTSSTEDPVGQTRQALYGLGDGGGGSFRAVKWPNGIVPVCFDAFQLNDYRPKKVQWILNDTWGLPASVVFLGFGACTGSKAVRIHFGPSPTGRTETLGAGYPEGGQVYRELYIKDEDDDTSMASRAGVDLRLSFTQLSRFRHVVIHEMGHALGFIHEHQRPDAWGTLFGLPAPPCNPAPFEIPPDQYSANWEMSPNGRYLTAGYDPFSVMNYCAIEPGTNLSGTQNLSAGDVTGVINAYGGAYHYERPRNILWRYKLGVGGETHGLMNMWHTKGTSYSWTTQPTYASPGRVDLGYNVVGAGDFDGDGIGDIIWRNGIDGQIAIWYMNSGNVRAQTGLYGTGLNGWIVVGTGDFNGDRISDILWFAESGPFKGQIAIWPSGSQTGSYTRPAQPDGWRPVAIGKFDVANPQYSGVLWHNGATGQLKIWRRGDPALAWTDMPTQSPSWQIKGVGKFGGDAADDILWRSTWGQVAIWFNRQGTSTRLAGVGPTDAHWIIKGVGDFDGDGLSDIFWWNDLGVHDTAIWWRGYGPEAPTLPPSMPPAAGNWQFEGIYEDLED